MPSVEMADEYPAREIAHLPGDFPAKCVPGAACTVRSYRASLEMA